VGGLLADVAPAAGLEAGEREVVLAAVLGEGDGAGEAEAGRVDAEVALAAAEADAAGDGALARCAGVGRAAAVVEVDGQQVLGVEVRAGREQHAPGVQAGTPPAARTAQVHVSPRAGGLLAEAARPGGVEAGEGEGEGEEPLAVVALRAAQADGAREPREARLVDDWMLKSHCRTRRSCSRRR